ncbi:MAG: hypothetical protein AB1668_03210 [Nanoarchaeota archaeon]
MNPIKVVCKNCGRQAPADTFKLHYKYKMMVCPECFSGKTEQKKEQMKKEQAQPQKPAGWDKEDEYLERMVAVKKREEPQFSRIPGTDQIKLVCVHCKYSFKYNPVKNMPGACPYCNGSIPKIRGESLY